MSSHAALLALDSGKPDDAIALLVEEWRRTRAPALADALDALSRWVRVRARGRGIEAKTAAARARQFDALAAGGHAADLEFLLDGIGNEKIEEARRRVEALRAFAPDPRLSRGLLELVGALPWSARSTMPFWTLVADVIAACADPRADETIAGVRARLMPLVGSERTEMIEIKLRKVTAALERAGAPRALTDGERAAIDEVAARVRGMTGDGGAASDDGEALLAAVYETPEADEPRQIYADWLQERGDPRGDFLALQLQRARTGEPPSLRERKLLGTWQKAWLGPLGRGKILDDKRTRFERGFFAAGTLLARGIDTIVGHREWATCEELDVGALASSAPTLMALLRDPAMRALRTIWRLPVGALWELAERPLRRPLVEVGLSEPLEPSQLARLARREGLESLRRVRLTVADGERMGTMLLGALDRLDPASFELVSAGKTTLEYRLNVRRGPSGTRIEATVMVPSLVEDLAVLLRANALPAPIVVQLPSTADGDTRIEVARMAEAVGARAEISARRNRGG